MTPETDFSDDKWRARGACLAEDPTVFFPIGEHDPDTERALVICRTCPVQEECLTYALETNQHAGIWGGTTESQRRRMFKGIRLDETHQLGITSNGLEVIRLDPQVSLDYRKRIDPVIAALAQTPEALEGLSPREFEELVARILELRGYSVQLTQSSRDGGIDIYASSPSDLGEDLLYLVQCKRYLKHPVGAPDVQSLFGAVTMHRATQGVLVTTSFFTGPAKNYALNLQHILTLRDRHNLEQWIQETRIC